MSVALQGTERTYHIDCTSTNAICAIEEATGLRVHAALEEIQGPSPRMATVRAFLRAVLVEPADVSLDQAGVILDDIGWATLIGATVAAINTKPRLVVLCLVDDVGARLCPDDTIAQMRDEALAKIGMLGQVLVHVARGALA